MSNGYYYSYPQTAAEHPGEGSQQWDAWLAQQPQYSQTYLRIASNAFNPPPPPSDHRPSIPPTRTQSYHPPQGISASRPYLSRRYMNYESHHYGNRQPHWQRNQRYKRNRTETGIDLEEPRSKSAKKKKKPLSQNVPNRKGWTQEEAEKALNVEKELNKRFKNASLLIKFPDLELNKEIVAKFHSAIENVHFQQPSAPRFCFVTLKDSADPNTVIKQLNTQRFGDGYITAEYKKDREEDQNVGPGDIDPLTLYVGNLAQDITKEDMVKTYPKVRRIDIGYAKKMKYTRYAFVSFSTVADAIEAFKKTHHTEMYSKSLIVRFRRLHGPVGMPGETKQQNPPKSKDTTATPAAEQNGSTSSVENRSTEDLTSSFAESLSPMDLGLIKEEPDYSDDEPLEDLKARIFSGTDLFSVQTTSDSGKTDFETNREMRSRVAQVKQEPTDGDVIRIKSEPNEERNASSSIEVGEGGSASSNPPSNSVKQEPAEAGSDSDDSYEPCLGVDNYDSVYSSFISEANEYQGDRESLLS